LKILLIHLFHQTIVIKSRIARKYAVTFLAFNFFLSWFRGLLNYYLLKISKGPTNFGRCDRLNFKVLTSGKEVADSLGRTEAKTLDTLFFIWIGVKLVKIFKH
jgi:hypothetical protein